MWDQIVMEVPEQRYTGTLLHNFYIKKTCWYEVTRVRYCCWFLYRYCTNCCLFWTERYVAVDSPASTAAACRLIPGTQLCSSTLKFVSSVWLATTCCTTFARFLHSSINSTIYQYDVVHEYEGYSPATPLRTSYVHQSVSTRTIFPP